MRLPTHALTLHQPYAWLVSLGYKDIENRPRTFSHRSFRGDFWIHAGLVESQETWDQARGHTDRVLGADFLLPPFGELALGAIIGRATITGVHLLKVHVMARGYQGFWRVPSDVLAKLREAA